MNENITQKNEDFFMDLLDRNIMDLFKRAFKIILRKPQYIMFLLKTILKQKRAINIRERWEKTGLHVPPFMILSITDSCNLKCKGCYASIHKQFHGQEITEDTLRRVLTEAEELGISIILIAGGEPFARKGITDILQDYPGIIFPVFTNGLLINSELINKLKKAKNIIPIISLEGGKDETDLRRGDGVYEILENIIYNINSSNIINGISFTLTRNNYSSIIDEEFMRAEMKNGSDVFFFIEYVPVEEGTDELIISEEQRQELKCIMEKFRSQFPGIFISFPGDEEELGGCLAAGRGFIHVNARGNIEPCPFAPYSDTNLNGLSLKEGLNSEFLKKIRSNRDILEEKGGQGGCTLWAKQDIVKTLLDETQAINRQ